MNFVCYSNFIHASTTSSKYLFKGFNTFVFADKRPKFWHEGRLSKRNHMSHWLVI